MATNGKKKRHGPTVLIVDDDPSALQFLTDLLHDLAGRIFTASNGTQAQSIIRSKPLDLALVDLRLPDLSGVEVLKTLRRERPGCIRLLITAHSDFEAAARAVNQAGIYHVLIKPADPNYLISVVCRALEHQQAERERLRLTEKLTQVNRRLEIELRKRTRASQKFERDLIRTRKELELIFWNLVNATRLSSLGLMTSVLAHDIRNPLTVLSGQLQILSAKADATDPICNRLSSMTRQVERIQELLDGVAKLVHNNSTGNGNDPQTGLPSERTSLRQALGEAMTLTRKLFSNKGLEVAVDFPEEDITVRGDLGQWIHILFKILEFIGREASQSQVFVQVERTAADACISVRYPGAGIPASLRKAINARTMPPDNKSDQETISFYLCSCILKQYGGRLNFVKRNHEVVFEITSPLEREAVQRVNSSPELEEAAV